MTFRVLCILSQSGLPSKNTSTAQPFPISNATQSLYITVFIYLQLSLCLRLLEHRLHLRSLPRTLVDVLADNLGLAYLHDIPLDLQFPRHEQPLCLCLPTNQLSKIVV